METLRFKAHGMMLHGNGAVGEAACVGSNVLYIEWTTTDMSIGYCYC